LQRPRKSGSAFSGSWKKPPPLPDNPENIWQMAAHSQGARIHASQIWNTIIRVGITR
jgi:hypothetical protein